MTFISFALSPSELRNDVKKPINMPLRKKSNEIRIFLNEFASYNFKNYIETPIFRCSYIKLRC